jgi:ABC-type sugar transport system permease subunit
MGRYKVRISVCISIILPHLLNTKYFWRVFNLWRMAVKLPILLKMFCLGVVFTIGNNVKSVVQDVLINMEDMRYVWCCFPDRFFHVLSM